LKTTWRRSLDRGGAASGLALRHPVEEEVKVRCFASLDTVPLWGAQGAP